MAPDENTPNPRAQREWFLMGRSSPFQITTQWAAPSSGPRAFLPVGAAGAVGSDDAEQDRCAPYREELKRVTCSAGHAEAHLRVRPSCVQPRRGCGRQPGTSEGLRLRGAAGAFAWVRGGARDGPGVCVDERDLFPVGRRALRGAGDGRGRFEGGVRVNGRARGAPTRRVCAGGTARSACMPCARRVPCSSRRQFRGGGATEPVSG